MSEPGAWIELYDLSDGGHDDWRSWYDTTYLQPRAAIPGVLAARRGRGVGDRIPQRVPAAAPMEIALYDLVDISVTDSEGWRAVRPDAGRAAPAGVAEGGNGALFRLLFSTASPYDPPSAAILHGGFFEVPARHHDEFNAWYELEHVQDQLKIGGYLNARRLQGMIDTDRFVALYDVSSMDATESASASAAMSSPWGDRIRHTLVTSRARRLFRVERMELSRSDDASDVGRR